MTENPQAWQQRYAQLVQKPPTTPTTSNANATTTNQQSSTPQKLLTTPEKPQHTTTSLAYVQEGRDPRLQQHQPQQQLAAPSVTDLLGQSTPETLLEQLGQQSRLKQQQQQQTLGLGQQAANLAGSDPRLPRQNSQNQSNSAESANSMQKADLQVQIAKVDVLAEPPAQLPCDEGRKKSGGCNEGVKIQIMGPHSEETEAGDEDNTFAEHSKGQDECMENQQLKESSSAVCPPASEQSQKQLTKFRAVLPQAPKKLTDKKHNLEEREEGEIIEETQKMHPNQNQSAQGPPSGGNPARSSPDVRYGGKESGQSAWNNQKRDFQGSSGGNMPARPPQKGEGHWRSDNRREPGRHSNEEGMHGGFSGRPRMDTQNQSMPRHNYRNERQDYGGQGDSAYQRGHHYDGYNQRPDNQRPYQAGPGERRYNSRPGGGEFQNYERRGGFHGNSHSGYRSQNRYDDAPKMDRFDDQYRRQDHYRGGGNNDSYQRGDFNRNRQWQGDNQAPDRAYSRGSLNDRMGGQGHHSYRGRDEPHSHFSNRGGFNRYGPNQGRSPALQRSRSRSASPPRGKPGFDQHHQERRESYGYQNQQREDGHTRRGGYQGGSREDNPSGQEPSQINNGRPSSDQQPSSRNLESGTKGDFFYVKSDDVWVSKSDYNNPNNPNYMGRSSRGRGASIGARPGDQGQSGRGGQNQQRQFGHRSPTDPRSRSPSPDGYSERNSNRFQQSSPLNQKRESLRDKEATSQHRQNDEVYTTQIKVAASSPSQPALNIVRRVPPKPSSAGVSDPEVNAAENQRTQPKQTGNERPAERKSQDRDSALSYSSPKSDNRGENQPFSQPQAQQAQDSEAQQRAPSQQSHCSNWSGKDHDESYSAQKPAERNDSHTVENERDDDEEALDDIPAFDAIHEEEKEPEPVAPEPEQDNVSQAQEQPAKASEQPQEQSAVTEGGARDVAARESKENDQDEASASAHQRDYHHQKGEKVIHDHEGNRIDPQDNCNIYVAGIPRRTTEDQLRKHFSQFGSILNVHVIKDHNTKVSRGFAYILFKSGQEANDAIKETDQTKPFNDWNITVEHAKRGEIVTEETIEKFAQRQSSRPYGSSQNGYDYSSGQNYSNSHSRGGHQSSNYDRDYEGRRGNFQNRDQRHNSHFEGGYNNRGNSYSHHGQHRDHHQSHGGYNDGYYPRGQDSGHARDQGRDQGRDYYHRNEHHSGGDRGGHAPYQRGGYRGGHNEYGRDNNRFYEDRDRYSGGGHNQGPRQGYNHHQSRDGYHDEGSRGRYGGAPSYGGNDDRRFDRREGYGSGPPQHGGYQGGYGSRPPYRGGFQHHQQRRSSPPGGSNRPGQHGMGGMNHFGQDQQRRARHSRSRSRSPAQRPVGGDKA